MPKNAFKIKILTAYHKPSVILNNEVIVPIQVGCACSNVALDMIGDDTGDNISQLNPRFCELTGIYWAWKNQDKIDNPDYIGFMHYRRFFYFKNSKSELKEIDFIYKKCLANIKCTKNNISDILVENDLICMNPRTLKSSVYKQYAESPFHNISDLDKALEILYKKYPEFKKTAKSYLNGNKAYFFNMFVMKKDIFNDYCSWLFDILFELDNSIDYSDYSSNQKRAIGFISERLTGIYIKYLIDCKKINYKSFPVAILNDTEIQTELFPTFSQNNVTICFSSDNNYFPYLAVAIKSLIENSTPDKNYDIYILNTNINKINKDYLSEMLENKKNVSVKYVNIAQYLKKTGKFIFTVNSHFSIETYYRFFIPSIFKNFEKILYLDTDMIILDDVAKIFEVDLGDNILAATNDTEVIRLLHSEKTLKIKKYFTEKLELKDSYNYFQAGVLLFNIKKMITENIQEKFIRKLIEVKHPIFVDQDILNSVCQGQTLYLPLEWNVEWQTPIFSKNPKKELPAEHYEKYMQTRKNPKIIHYAGIKKPWDEPQHELAEYFWKYAKETPFYDKILAKKTRNKFSLILKYIKVEIMSIFSFGPNKKKYIAERKNIRQNIIN